MRDGTNPPIVGRREVHLCDGCRHEYPRSLLTAVGKGVLRVCPKCLPEALATIQTDAVRAAATA